MKNFTLSFKRISAFCFLLAAFSLNGIAQANIAPSATVTATGTGAAGCQTGACSTLNDLNLGTCGTQQMWINTNTPPSAVIGDDYIEWNFPTVSTFDSLIIHHGDNTARFLTGATVQYYNGTAWVTHTSFTNLPQNCINRISIGKLSSDQFRITAFEMTGTGQQSNVNFREIEIIEAPTGLNDAAVVSVDSPRVFCTGMQDVIVTIGNFGINQIDSVDIAWEVNGVAQPTISYKQLLDTINGTNPFSAQINLGTLSFNAGSNDIFVYTTAPNGGVDTVNVNDTLDTSVQSAAAPLAINILNPTLSSAQVDAVGGAGTVEHEYGVSGFTLGTGTTGSSPTSLFTITGLAQGTTYDVYVRSNCGSNDTSVWVGPETFNTSYGVPYFQDFENFTAGITGNPWPEGWSSTTTTDPNWESEDAGTPSGGTGPLNDHTLGTASGIYSYMETSGGTVGDSADFVSPPIYLDSSMSTVELTYWYFNFGADIDRMEVVVDTNGVEEIIATYTGQQQTAQTDDWLLASHFLAGYEGKSITIKFRGFNVPCCSGDIAIDDVGIDPVPQLNAGVDKILNPGINGALCAGTAPISVVVANKGIDTITSFSVVSDVNGVLDTSSFSLTVPSGDTVHVNLNAATFNTGANNLSAYTIDPNSGIDGFNGDDTLSIVINTANAPNNFSTINETLNSVDILAGNFADSLEIEYGIVGFTQGTGTLVSPNSVPFTLSGLAQGTAYEVYMRAICGTNDTSIWVGPFVFNTSYGLPFFQDFENFGSNTSGTIDLEGWRNIVTGTPQWQTGASTTSGNTGPEEDHTIGLGGIFAYLETSSGALNGTDTLLSPPVYIDTNLNTVEVSYWFHMYGATINSLEVFADTNGTLDSINTINGEQQLSQDQSSWINYSTYLTGYQGKSVTLVFVATRGSSFTGDVSIDDVGIDPVPQLSTKMESIIEPSGSLCGGSIDPIVAIGNGGIDTITFVDIVTDINGVLDTTRYNGSLAIGDTTHVALPTITILTGTVYDLQFYTIDPNGGTDGFNGDDTLKLNGLTTGLQGTITLDASLPASATNYISFSALANQLNAVGVCGNVTIDVAAGTYNDVFLLDNVPGLSTSDRLTIDGGDSALVFLENNLANDDGLVAFNATSYVTLKNMTLQSTRTGGGDHFGVHFSGASSYDSIVNCRILMDPTSSFGAFGVGASSDITNDFAEGDNANYVTVMNCAIDGGSYSIHFEGPSTGYNLGNAFINNTLTNMDDYGFYMDQQDSMKIIGNSITGMRSSFGDGIACYDPMNFEINANLILVEDRGIYISDANSDDFADREATLINNMVTSFGDYGIYLTDPSRINIWHNSVYSEGTAAAVRFRSAIDSLDMRNNVFSSESDVAFEMSGAADTTVFLKFDNNVFYTASAGDLLDINGGYATLAAYQTARPGFNVNSLEGLPEFASDSNLHIIGSFINDAGDNGVNVLTDIDGETRPSTFATFVDPGADEFDPPACAAPTQFAVSIFSGDSASAIWLSNTAGTNVQVSLTSRGSSILSGAIDTTSLDTFNLDSLTPETQYDVYIREVCRRGDTSIWIGPIEFETPCLSFTAPYTEDFENGGTIPNCMKQGANNAEDWIFATTGGHVGNAGTISGSTISNNFFAYVDDSSPHNQGTTLETPFVDISGLTNPTLEFYRISDNESNPNDNVDFTVEVWDGAAWNQVYFADTNSLNTAWEFISIPLNTLTITGDIQARFIVDENNGGIFDDDVAIDDIYIGDRLPLDVGVITVISPQSLSGNDSCNLGSTADLIVEVENFGTTLIDSLDVSFVFNNNTAITQRFTNLNLNLANTAQLTFDSTINLTTSGTYQLDVYTSLSGDGNLNNDTAYSTIVNEGFGGTLVGNDSICSGDTTSISVENSIGTVQWQELVSGVWTNITGADSLSIQISPSANTDYRVIACGVNASDSFRLDVINLAAPTTIGDTVVVACGGSGTATATASSTNTNPRFVWYKSDTALTPIDTSSGIYSITASGDSLRYFKDTTVIGTPAVDTVWVSEVVNAGSGNNTLKITEIDLGGPDAIEIQNVSGQSIDVTGWTFAVSDSYADVNLTNGTVQTLSGSMSPNQISYWTDGATNAWGSNLFWNPGSNGWAIIIDDNGNVVDYVAWQWDNATLLTQSLTINGFTVTPASSDEWDGDGINGTGVTNSLYRTGNADVNDLTDFTTSASDFGTANTGLNTPFAGGECVSPRSMAILMIDCVTGLENSASINNSLSIYPNPSNGIFKLDISTENRTNYNLVMRDMKGKVVYSNDLVVNGSYQDQLDFSNLAKGVYFMQIKTPEAIEVKKLIIQ